MEQREAEGEKVNNAVLFDQPGCDKMLVEVPKYKMITPVLCDTLRAPKKEKAPPLASKSAKSSEGKQKKKKWSIGKHKKKVNNAVFFDQASYDKILVEVPKYKMITPVLCDRLRQVPVCQQDCRQSVVPMVQCQRREKSRLPSNLPTFSAFSRVLYLVGSSSVTKARLSKRPEKENGVLERPAKIRRPESSSSVCDNKEQDRQEEAIVQADFAFFDPKPSDFHGVKLLLQSYLDDKPWDLSGFVDLILGQPTVGTVVKLDAGDQDCEEDGDDGDNEDIYGVITALNLGRYGDHQCMVELREFLLAVCGDENMKMKLKVLLEQNPYGVGLLVSQRFVNCPHELIPPLYDALFDEVSWATEDEPTEKLRDSFQFRFYLLVTRIYELKHAKQCNAKTKLDCDDPIIYLKAEDEIFHEMSLFSFTFPLHASRFVPYELKNYRSMGLIMIITADAVPKFREKLNSLLAES